MGAVSAFLPRSVEEKSQLQSAARLSATVAVRLLAGIAAFWTLAFGLLAWASELEGPQGVALATIGGTSLTNASFGSQFVLILSDGSGAGAIEIATESRAIPTLALALVLTVGFLVARRVIRDKGPATVPQVVVTAWAAFSGVIVVGLVLLNLGVSRYAAVSAGGSGPIATLGFPPVLEFFLPALFIGLAMVAASIRGGSSHGTVRFVHYLLVSLRNFSVGFGAIVGLISLWVLGVDLINVEIVENPEVQATEDALLETLILQIFGAIMFLPTIALTAMWARAGGFFTIELSGGPPELLSNVLESFAELIGNLQPATAWSLWEESPGLTGLTLSLAALSAAIGAFLAAKQLAPASTGWWRWPLGLAMGLGLMLVLRHFASAEWTSSLRQGSHNNLDDEQPPLEQVALLLGPSELTVVAFGIALFSIFTLLAKPKYIAAGNQFVDVLVKHWNRKTKVAVFSAVAVALAVLVAINLYQRYVITNSTPESATSTAMDTLLRGSLAEAKSLFDPTGDKPWLPEGALEQFRLSAESEYSTEFFNENGGAWSPGELEGYAEITVLSPKPTTLVFDFSGTVGEGVFGSTPIKFDGAFQTPHVSLGVSAIHEEVGLDRILVGDEANINPGTYSLLPGHYKFTAPKRLLIAEDSRELAVGTKPLAVALVARWDSSPDTLEQIEAAIEEDLTNFVEADCLEGPYVPCWVDDFLPAGEQTPTDRRLSWIPIEGVVESVECSLDDLGALMANATITEPELIVGAGCLATAELTVGLMTADSSRCSQFYWDFDECRVIRVSESPMVVSNRFSSRFFVEMDWINGVTVRIAPEEG